MGRGREGRAREGTGGAGGARGWWGGAVIGQGAVERARATGPAARPPASREAARLAALMIGEARPNVGAGADIVELASAPSVGAVFTRERRLALGPAHDRHRSHPRRDRMPETPRRRTGENLRVMLGVLEASAEGTMRAADVIAETARRLTLTPYEQGQYASGGPPLPDEDRRRLPLTPVYFRSPG